MLREFIQFSNGKPLESQIDTNGEVNLITLDSVDISGKLKHIHKRVKKANGSLFPGDIVTVLSTVVADLNQGNLLGMSAIIPSDGTQYVLNQRMGRIRVVNGSLRSDFLRLCLNASSKHFAERAQGTSQKNIYARDFFSLPIQIPPLEEQKAIAEVLSDVDELIAQTERLIAKKEAIKMGVMQELLRPKEGWEWTTLGNLVGTITTGKLNANAMKENGEFRFYTCSKEFYWIDSFAFDGEAILVSGNGANVGYVHHYSGKFNAYQRTYVLMDFKIYPVFLKHYLLRFFSERVKTEVSAGNTPYIKMGTIADMIIWFPSELTIQSAIAEAISDVDEELGALRELNFKYERLKMGIMNQLLTGKTRLV